MDGFTGKEGLGAYSREAPENFQGPGSGDDQFMHSTIMGHSTEGATATGQKTGEFTMSKAQAREQAKEVLSTHMSLKGAAAEEYLNKNFDKSWDHFDVNHEGKVAAATMSPFFRHLTGNVMIDLLA